LKDSDKDFIKSKYESQNFKIVKYKNVYVVVLNKQYDLPYFNVKKYISILNKILDIDLKIITFQI
jgi:hypothetical protein